MADISDFNAVSGSDLPGRSLPYSQEAEEAVIGCVLLDPVECREKAMEMLKPEHFYRPKHQQIFSIMMRMFTTGKAEDVVTVVDEAVNAGVFENSAMAMKYLYGLMDNVPSTKNIESYCNIILQKAQLRSLMNVANEIIASVSDGAGDPKALLDSAEQKIFSIRQGRDLQGLTRISDVIVENFHHLTEISGPDAEKYQGARSGFSQLDHVTTGLQKTDLIVLAARPAMGKSAFALNIAVNCCKATKRDVAIFSLEMGKEQLVGRMLASEGKVNNTLLRNGEMKDEDWTKLAEAADVLSQLPIYLDDGAGGVTVPQMKAKLRRLNNLGLVVIDYIQLMESPNKHSSRVNEVSEITRQIKLMAKELSVPVIALSQLSRNAEKRDDKRPLLSDLRESGSIEQDADIILFLYRDAYYSDSKEDQTVAECIVAKNRHGQLGTIKLSWIGEYTLFRGLEFRKDEK
ncbi:replicative DNA helicase [Ruminococcus albus]|jgi:replicative DNA helicase|uniref:Replicative DNA helicase n=1 Tax=Ruminococcus albus SY3 TaxID=1341156 RepID=A0A011WKW8_RUMAL|nr:replicative DNA helicase [Ruminococcus albus]EXM37675.1 DNA helicase [Ruminococcus albus SY3]MBE6868622.1 replicative DNA helicase [Ruminococcus albus]MBP5268497.1 replicative DNA helicase [Ruminococcus sp.]